MFTLNIKRQNYEMNILRKVGTCFQLNQLEIFAKIRVVKSFEFKKFNIGIDLDSQPDIIRSWTFTDKDGNRFITNGLSIIQQFTLIIDL